MGDGHIEDARDPARQLWMATSPPETMAAIMRISFMMLIHAGRGMPPRDIEVGDRRRRSLMPTV